MKILSFLFLFLSISPSPIDEIKLDKTQKVLSTFSGTMDETKSFHFILTKNLEAKKHNLLPYVFESGVTKEMPVIEFDNKFDILSFHVKDEVITLITKTKIDRETSIDVMDINTKDGSVSRAEKIFQNDDLKTVLRGSDKNVLIYVVEKELAMVTINSANDHLESYLTVNNENRDFIIDLIDKPLDAINTNEYVKNGSINDYKAYLNHDQVIITKDHKRFDNFKMLKLSTLINGKQQVEIQSIKVEEPGKFKKGVSYMYGDKAFLLNTSKKEAQIDIVDVKNDSKRTIDLLNPELSKLSSNKEATATYLKKASKSFNQPTITINEAKNNSYTIRMDYVNKNNYNYYYNWWWHHNWMMQNMMWQQQQMIQQTMRNLPSRFGPNVVDGDHNIYANSSFINKETFFEIGIDATGNLVGASKLETVYPIIDKKDIIDKLNAHRNLRHASTAFKKLKYTYIAFNKDSKSFKIIEKDL